MKLKNYQIEKILSELQKIKKYNNAILLKYRIKIIKELESELEYLKEATRDEEWDIFQKKISDINIKYSIKDKEGNSKLNDNNEYLFSIEGRKKRDKEIEKIKEENKDLIKKREEFSKTFEELLNSDCSEDFTKIPFSIVPEDCNQEDFELLFYFDFIDVDK